MKIEVKLFGITKDIIGDSIAEVELGDNQTVEELRSSLTISYPALGDLRSVMVAVNNEYADDDKPIRSSDEVALIPPVSGG